MNGSARARGPWTARQRIAEAGALAAAVVTLMPGALTLLGGYLPGAPTIGPLGALLNDGLGSVWISVVTGAALSLLAMIISGRRAAVPILVISLLAVGGAGYVTYRYAAFAGANGLEFSLARQFQAETQPRSADVVMPFLTADGATLRADLWLPPSPSDPTPAPAPRPIVVYVHGGAFVAGGLGMRPHLFETLAHHGLPVLDVEYRLSPPPRWDQAPADVLCALALIPGFAREYSVDQGAVVVLGESAGGNLALLAAYAATTDLAPASCAGKAPRPAGVIAVAPTADLAGIWRDATLTAANLPFPEAYVGGTPAEFPDRYSAASPLRLIRSDVPPTLLLIGEQDHLVRPERVKVLADQLQAAGADVRMLVAPFADHGFDGPPNGFGAQIEAQLVVQFTRQVTSWAG